MPNKTKTHLVWRRVELLGVEGGAETQRDALAEENVVGESGNTAVVDLGLGEGERVDAVLGGDLETDVGAALGVPDSLGTGLDLRVDLVVVGGGEDAQVARGDDGGGVERLLVADTERVAGDGGLLDVVAGLGTDEEAVVADDGIEVRGWAVQEVEEGTGVEVWLLEVQVELDALGLGGGEEAAQDLGLEALGDVVVELDLGLEGVGSVPGLGDGQACASVDH